jgi:hypothetical protein
VEFATAFKVYRGRILVDKQEAPANIIATLKAGPRHAEQLLKWLRSHPASLHFALRTVALEEELEELIRHIESQTKYWRPHAEQARTKRGILLRARQDLYCSLNSFLRTYLPGANERERRRLIADLFRAAEIKISNEKKNRKRFTGAASQP